ncbi:MAG: hypothetical protein Q7S40_08270 [Opitutaceae bacterium]|nr:hypothetical protein [Opitutaceae bacterium]
MITAPQPNYLRAQLATHLDSLQELTVRRNVLLGRAAIDPRPSVAHALRTKRETADAIRRSIRLVRAQLAQLEEPQPRTNP